MLEGMDSVTSSAKSILRKDFIQAYEDLSVDSNGPVTKRWAAVPSFSALNNKQHKIEVTSDESNGKSSITNFFPLHKVMIRSVALQKQSLEFTRQG